MRGVLRHPWISPLCLLTGRLSGSPGLRDRAGPGPEATFHQFEQGTSDRIRYQRINERTGAEVSFSEIVRGADVGGGRYVMIGQKELDAVAPGQSRSMDVRRFVDLDEIGPIYFDKAYFLGPGSDETRKTYALLRDAMAESGKVAIASFVMRGKEYLAAVRAQGELLVLETLFFADEVRNPQGGESRRAVGRTAARRPASPRTGASRATGTKSSSRSGGSARSGSSSRSGGSSGGAGGRGGSKTAGRRSTGTKSTARKGAA